MDENKNGESPIHQPSESLSYGQLQSLQSSTSNTSDNQTQSPEPSKWRHLFIVLGTLQGVGVVLFLFLIVGLTLLAKMGVSGTEFIALIFLVMIVPALASLALVNLIGLPVYMAKQKPHGKSLKLCVVSLAVSVVLVAYGAYGQYQARVAQPRREQLAASQLQQKMEQSNRQFARDNAKPEITKAEAIQLLKTCQLRGFYYTDQTDRTSGDWGELSSTGVVLTKIDGKPYRISIADRLVPELVPIAREAQKTCGDLQFWHDGRYEQRQADGTWR